MQIENPQMEQLINLVVTNTIKVLEEKKLLGKANEKTAFQKTESLLYNYNNFRKIIQEKEQEIVEIQTYGVPQTCGGVKEYVDRGTSVSQIITDEERVSAAVYKIRESIAEVNQAIAMVDNGLSKIKNDPYASIIKMSYFDGMGLEDIGLEFKCTQQNISHHRARLVREMSLYMFPTQIIKETLGK